LHTTIAPPDLGRFSAPCQSRLAINLSNGRTTDAPNLNQFVAPKGLPLGGAYEIFNSVDTA